MEEMIDILYEGYQRYMKRTNGFLTCAKKLDILYWEIYKQAVSERLEAIRNNGKSKNT